MATIMIIITVHVQVGCRALHHAEDDVSALQCMHACMRPRSTGATAVSYGGRA